MVIEEVDQVDGAPCLTVGNSEVGRINALSDDIGKSREGTLEFVIVIEFWVCLFVNEEGEEDGFDTNFDGVSLSDDESSEDDSSSSSSSLSFVDIVFEFANRPMAFIEHFTLLPSRDDDEKQVDESTLSGLFNRILLSILTRDGS